MSENKSDRSKSPQGSDTGGKISSSGSDPECTSSVEDGGSDAGGVNSREGSPPSKRKSARRLGVEPLTTTRGTKRGDNPVEEGLEEFVKNASKLSTRSSRRKATTT